jgi:hypothetical protein
VTPARPAMTFSLADVLRAGLCLIGGAWFGWTIARGPLLAQRAGTSEHAPLDGCGNLSRIADSHKTWEASPVRFPLGPGTHPISHPIAVALRGRALRAGSDTTRGSASYAGIRILRRIISHFPGEISPPAPALSYAE